MLRALRGLVRDGRLVRLGYGVYGRAVVSRLSGEPLLYAPYGFRGAAREALTSSALNGSRQNPNGRTTKAVRRRSR